MIKNNKIILSIITIGVLSGCTPKQNQFNVSVINSFKKMNKSNKVVEKIVNSQEKITEDKCLDFSVHKRLSSLLQALSKMNGKIYHLKGKDITYPIFSPKDSKIMGINSISKLVSVTPTITDYAINIKTTFGGKINMVSVVDKYQKDSNLLNVKLKVNGKVPLSFIMKKISNITDFNVIYTLGGNGYNNGDLNIMNGGGASPIPNNLSSKGKNSLTLLQDKKIYFKGSSIKEFFNYVSQLFDVYIDVDYKKKLIKIIKYKTKVYNLLPLIATASSSVSLTPTQMNSESGNSPTTLKSGVPVSSGNEPNKIQALMSALRQLIQQNGGNIINVSDGLVSVRSTKNGFNKINKIVDRFNSKYSKMVDIEITTYQFIVSKNFNIGLDLKYITDKIGVTTSNLTSVLATYVSTNGHNKASLGFNSDSVKFLKKYAYEGNFLNGVQTLINTTSSRDYLKSLKTETTTNTATTVSTKTPEIGKINQGETFGVTPNIFGNKVLINASLKLNVLNNLTKEKLSNNGDYISLPDISTQSIPINTLIRVGDKMVVGVYQLYQKSRNYKGIIPNDSFLIGGSRGDSLIKQLVIVTAEVKKIIE